MENNNKFGYTFEKGTLSLAGEQTINPNKLYMVDFSKLNSVNDLVLILAAMSIAFPGDHPHIDKIKAFLNTEKPLDIPGREEMPVQKDLKLPKLKSIK